MKTCCSFSSQWYWVLIGGNLHYFTISEYRGVSENCSGIWTAAIQCESCWLFSLICFGQWIIFFRFFFYHILFWYCGGRGYKWIFRVWRKWEYRNERERRVVKSMDASKRTFSDLVGLLKSWIPWRSEPAHVSRDFWMPDQSCRVCYECDSQFTLFNRRHHCRLCGRIFCAKCTSNWVPTPSSEPKIPLEEWDKIRVCNYCFKQWQQGLTAPVENGVRVANLDLSSTSPSASSFISTKSSVSCDTSSMTFVSPPQSAGLSPYQSPIMRATMERQSIAAAMNNDHDADTGEQNLSQDQLQFFPNRLLPLLPLGFFN